MIIAPTHRRYSISQQYQQYVRKKSLSPAVREHAAKARTLSLCDACQLCVICCPCPPVRQRVANLARVVFRTARRCICHENCTFPRRPLFQRPTHRQHTEQTPLAAVVPRTGCKGITGCTEWLPRSNTRSVEHGYHLFIVHRENCRADLAPCDGLHPFLLTSAPFVCLGFWLLDVLATYSIYP